METFNRLASCWVLSLLVTLLLADSPAAGQWKPPATNKIPPEIVSQMDPEILSGKRPTFHNISQDDIFGLRDNPKLEADFVRFAFDPAQLSTVQTDIMRKWVSAGHNRVFLFDDQLVTYARLLGVSGQKMWYGSGGWESKRDPAPKLMKHPVNTDCQALRFYFEEYRSGWVADQSYRSYAYTLSQLPPDTSVIAEVRDGQAVAGSIPIGQGRVFFRHSATGTDGDRWVLNYWHWALGLPVPGSADRAAGGMSTTRPLAEVPKHDQITLKNGDTLTGDIRNEQISIQTSYGLLKFGRAEIGRITLEGAGANVDVVNLKNGDKLSGVIQERTLKIALVAGGEAEIEKDKIKEVRFRTEN